MQKQNAAYQKIVTAIKSRKNGCTAADITAATALELSLVNELLPKAADEYSGQLRITESGEILYYFPDGYASRYKGFGIAAKKIFTILFRFFKKVSVLLFKIWIVFMLIGYFVLFLAIALASVFITVASKSGGKGSGRGSSFSFGLFDILIRIWFYTELTRSYDDYSDMYKKAPPKKEKSPLHKAIFSFIFGDGDPNINWDNNQKKAVISYIQANSGVISLCEYMAFSGINSLEAQKELLSFCSKYDGSPEVTQEGTIVYRFDKLLLGTEEKTIRETALPDKKLKTFSVNSKTKNIVFALINGFNLFFGSYFFYQSFEAGKLITKESYKAASNIYVNVHNILSFFLEEPYSFIRIVLGLVPLLFSVFFWLIPLVRFFKEKKENENIKMGNFKRFGFNKIWSSPQQVDKFTFDTSVKERKIRNSEKAMDIVIKEISAVSMPEIEISENGSEIYSFNELINEKTALANYRRNIDLSKTQIGNTVFDSRD